MTQNFKHFYKLYFGLWSYSYGAQLHSTSTWITVTVYSKKKNMQLVGWWRLKNHVYIWGGKELFYNKDNTRNHALETLERLVNAQSIMHRVFTGHGLFWFHLGASKRACQALVLGPWWLYMVTWHWNRTCSITSRKKDKTSRLLLSAKLRGRGNTIAKKFTIVIMNFLCNIIKF